ncbi:MAG: cell division transport system permease protein [Alphaproteobacteria bacterium]|jgi:cell division transport system permease protein|nr:cell division transport system permease protein [Alphaproteobacteria bacterium]
MSTIDEGRRRREAGVAAATPLPRFETPIVPQSTIAGRALVAVVAIMTFLASLTAGGVLLVRGAANEWQADVAREVTIQVRPVAGRDLEADTAKVVVIASATPGVGEVRPYSKEEAYRLLEPWLGSDLQLDDLPVPRMIVVRIGSGAPPDLLQLRRTLADQVPPASLDDHRGFVDRMRAMSGAVQAGGVTVLLLVFVATVLSVTFATRAAMATNRPVIEVLHLIGAKDNFIAGHFQRHFLLLGLKGGVIGGGGAMLLFALTDFGRRWFVGTAGGDQFSALFGGSLSIGILGYLAVVALVGLIAFVTAATSRRIVNSTIAGIH